MGSKVIITVLIVAIVLIAVGYAMFAAIQPTETPSTGKTTPPAPLTCTPSLKCEGNSRYEVKADCSEGERIPCGASETCVNGACVPSTPPATTVTNTTRTCEDSDGGLTYYNAGIITACEGSNCITQTEACNGKQLIEYLCNVEKKVLAINMTCPNTCADGACVK